MIKDYQLFMVVGVLLAIDLAIMTTWQVSDPFYRATKQMEPYVSIHSHHFNTKTSYLQLRCVYLKLNTVTNFIAASS